MNPQSAPFENGSPKQALAPAPNSQCVPAGASHQKGDADSVFAKMVRPAQERVFRLALRITRSSEDAEDVQQETFLKVHRKMGQFEGRSRFTTWISRIAINEALMCLRRRRSGTHVSLEETLQSDKERLPADAFRAPLEDPEEAYSRRELNESLARALAILRPAHRVVFLLRAVEQLSTTETAKILRISASSVKARMRRARHELQEILRVRKEPGTLAAARGGMATAYGRPEPAQEQCSS